MEINIEELSLEEKIGQMLIKIDWNGHFGEKNESKRVVATLFP